MKLNLVLNELKCRYFLGNQISKIKQEIEKYPKIVSENGPLVLCQAIDDVFFLHRLVHFLLGYSKLNSTEIKIGWVVLRKNFRSRSFKNRITDFLFRNWVTDALWLSIYKTMGGRVVLHYSKYSNTQQPQVWAQNTFSSLKSKEELVNLKIGDVVVGDLVYDTYLRFKPAATVNIEDPFLEELLAWAFDLLLQINNFLDNNSVSAVVTTYTSYIHHGLLVRLATQRGVPTYVVAAGNQIVLSATNDFPYHVRHFHKYKEFFETVPNKKEALSIGENIIQTRLSGKQEATTFYMSKSAYDDQKFPKNVLKNTTKPKAIIMAHDFYDSPHVYGKMLFPDFYEWVSFVFAEARNSVYEFYYKPHPNGLVDNNRINEDLKRQNPHINFIEKSTPNNRLLEEGVAIAFTVHGTVCHEFAYMGVPVINAATNPHSLYKFNICPQSRNELSDYVKGLKTPTLDSSDVAEFCYVHNFRYIDKSLTLFPFFSDTQNAYIHFTCSNLNERIKSMVDCIKRHNSI